jgi:hypothetical protein
MSEHKQKATVEVDAILAAAQQQAKAEAQKQRAADLKTYGNRVRKMSFRQLRSELRRMVKNDSGLNAAYAVVSLIVLENTKTRENPFAKLEAYPR